MPAVAFSNNDIAVVAWTFDKHLDGCLGFAIVRIDADGKETTLPALASFKDQPKDPNRSTAQAPVQKFWWKDLFAERGGTYKYRIVPMGGKPGALTPLAGVDPPVSNSVTLTEDRPPFKAFFNRGIVASQAVIHALGGKADGKLLGRRVADANDDIRKRLMGGLYAGVTSLLDRADAKGGEVHAALYELNDPNGLELRLGAKDHGDPKIRNVILGNSRIGKTDTSPAIEDADSENRANLKAAGVNVIDRILGDQRIPHNKFMVLSEAGKPVAVLTGSTNWTSTGLCTQTNNALVIESEPVAQRYMDFWNKIKTDIDAAKGDQSALQSADLRTWNHDTSATMIGKPIDLGGGATIEPLFSPSTKGLLPKKPTAPVDMKRLYDLVGAAKQAVLFLAFDPGNNSILDAAAMALAKNPDLFVRGALTSTQRAQNFVKALHPDAASEPPPDMHVSIIGDQGKPKKKGAKQKDASGTPTSQPDYRAIPAGSINKDDAFGAWEAELYKVGHAIIHNKVVVIDPFSDNCVVITGSHNLGYRASHNNDENMVIVRGHKLLAQAYACHVLDVYDHYAWRYWLLVSPEIFGKPLDETDQWQERYIVGPDEKSSELRFWLSAANAGVASPKPARPAGSASGAKAAKGETPAVKKSKAKKKVKKSKKAAKKKQAKKSAKKKTSKKKAAKAATKKKARKVSRTKKKKKAKAAKSRR
jgi:phosphatidylserine/phosphatidylglycerophosphate/cardiolipin synthase-like enzyme